MNSLKGKRASFERWELGSSMISDLSWPRAAAASPLRSTSKLWAREGEPPGQGTLGTSCWRRVKDLRTKRNEWGSSWRSTRIAPSSRNLERNRMLLPRRTITWPTRIIMRATLISIGWCKWGQVLIMQTIQLLFQKETLCRSSLTIESLKILI